MKDLCLFVQFHVTFCRAYVILQSEENQFLTCTYLTPLLACLQLYISVNEKTSNDDPSTGSSVRGFRVRV